MLKKIILTAAIFVAFQGMAHALTWLDISSSTLSNQSFYFKSSNAVGLVYANDSNAAPQAYTTAAKHTSGDRLYSTSSHSSNIMYKDYKNVAATGKGVPLSAAAASTFGDLPTVAGESLYTGWIAQ